jgi:hypothetical protein
MKMSEKYIEQQLVLEIKKRNGLCLKFVSPGWNGAPDRLVLLPDGKMGFVEVKAPGGKVRALQIHRLKHLMMLGFIVFILDKPEDIGEILDAIQGT